ncbi:hypothetical protein FGADI_13061 [Fusarium gaditjirri]|uniref:Uncharacterized protein n=1 Tax=Fusarium gaditjirri TaxID=282569 RepID=A0A8H4SQM5_9HYPO|nr:hypothetical protein FGADI_13061 [Fusarium gaditjirri]
MADNNKNSKNEKHERENFSEETRENLRRMTAGLTDQTTIETLSRAGMVAKNKREQTHFHRDKTVAHVEAEEEKDEDTSGGDEKSKKQT